MKKNNTTQSPKAIDPEADNLSIEEIRKDRLEAMGVNPDIFEDMKGEYYLDSPSAYYFDGKLRSIFLNDNPEDLSFLLRAGLSTDYKLAFSYPRGSPYSLEHLYMPLVYVAAQYDAVHCLKALVKHGVDLQSDYEDKRDTKSASLGLYTLHMDKTRFFAELSKHSIDVVSRDTDKSNLLQVMLEDPEDKDYSKTVFHNILKQMDTPSVFYKKNDEKTHLIKTILHCDETAFNIPNNPAFLLTELMPYLNTVEDIEEFEKEIKKLLKSEGYKQGANSENPHFVQAIEQNISQQRIKLEKSILQQEIGKTETAPPNIKSTFKV